MRVLIIALLALTANATSYGYGKYYSGSPAYSYGSSLYGASYGSGLGSGISYISDAGYGGGYGGYGLGGSGHSYYNSYKPVSYQTASHEHHQPHSPGAAYAAEYSSNEEPANIVFHHGDAGYQADTSAIAGSQGWKAPVTTIRHSYQQPHSVGAAYKSGYSSGAAPGNIAFTLGGTGYQMGTPGVSSYQKYQSPVTTKTIHRSGVQGQAVPAKISFVQDFSRTSGLHRSGGVSGISAIRPAAVITEKRSYQQPYSIGAGYKSGYYGGAAPGNIAFTLGGTGYQTGTSGVSGYQKWNAPAVTRTSGIYRQGTTTVHRGVQGHAAPAKINFVQDFSRTSGLHRSGGSTGISALRPATVITEKHSYQHPHSIGYRSGYSSNAAPGNIAFNLGGTGFHTGTSGVSDYQKWKAPAAIRPLSHRTSTIRHSGVQTATAGVAPAKISFTQDFSRISGQSALHRSGVTPVVSTFQKAIAPARSTGILSHHTTSVRQSGIQDATAGVVPGKITFTQDFPRMSGQSGLQRAGGTAGVSAFKKVIAPARPSYGIQSAHRSGAGSFASTGGQPLISFTQDFSKVAGHSGIAAVKPVIHSYDRVVTPVRTVVVPKIPADRYKSSGIIRETGFLGATGGQPQIKYIHGTSNVIGQPKQFEINPGFGLTVAGAPQGITSAGIGFNHDLSKVIGHQTPGVKPVISPINQLIVPPFDRVASIDGHQTRPNAFSISKPVSKLEFKAPKQHVSQEPAFSAVFEKSPVQRVLGGTSSHVADTPSLATGPAAGIPGGHSIQYKQEIVTVDGPGADKGSNFHVPASHDKLSTYQLPIQAEDAAVNGQRKLDDIVSYKI